MLQFPLPKELKGKKISLSFKKEIEPHEVLVDDLAQKREREIGISEKKLEIPLLRNVLVGFFLFSIFLFFLLFLGVIHLQFFHSENFSKLAEQNKYILRKIQAQRGVIYDKNLKQLVFNKSEFHLVLEKLPENEKKKEEIIEELAFILKKDKDLLKRKIEEKNFDFKIEDLQALILLETRLDKFEGFKIKEKNIREYKDKSLSHLLGYLGKIDSGKLKENPDFYSIDDFVGRDGLEKYYEEILRKIPGKIKIQRDAKGKIISKEIVSQPKSGKSLVLHLDFSLQKKIFEELEKQIKNIGAEAGAAVALDPKNGGVLAMVSWPTFDNNTFQSSENQKSLEALFSDPKKPLFNRALSGQYLLGSTIKPFIALAALEEKIIDPNKKIEAKGFIEIPHSYDPKIKYRFGDWAVHGLVDMRKAIAQSCNVYFYTIGGGYENQKGLGPTKIKKYLEIFDFGKPPKIDLPIPRDSDGLIGSPEWKRENLRENWWDGDTYNLSIGQGFILVSPLQVATAYLPIANGGKLFQPQILWKIVDENKNLIEEVKPKILKENFIDKKNLQIVREGMRWAVTGQNSPLASAVLLKDLPVSAAAKTGTAQVFRKNCQNCYNVWISVFAPFENPEILLVIVLEDVKGLPSHQIVVPLAKEILNWYFSK